MCSFSFSDNILHTDSTGENKIMLICMIIMHWLCLTSSNIVVDCLLLLYLFRSFAMGFSYVDDKERKKKRKKEPAEVFLHVYHFSSSGDCCYFRLSITFRRNDVLFLVLCICLLAFFFVFVKQIHLMSHHRVDIL